MEEFKICKELKWITPDIIRAWNEVYHETIYLVRKQIFYRCPLSHKLVSKNKCNNCTHNFGEASKREIYCLPNTDKIIGSRTKRKKERIIDDI